MIVCSCNVISDHDIRQAVKSVDETSRSPKQVYGCLGCSAECGRCARTIKSIIDEALGPCARACQTGCQHGHGHASVQAADDDLQSRFALAAC